jgi:hypothetical protein
MAVSSINIDKIKNQLAWEIIPLAFWSYKDIAPADISDEKLIEKVLRHGNDAQRELLKEIYPIELIRNIWESKLIIQGQSLQELNRKIAVKMFFISNPDSHIQKVYHKHNLYDRYSA